ncbi:uncharacterized protein C8Q71DRAFT_285904 [Rhodofomes roseus]|uniref:Uncharacterized protein n=1 Tax=Rhodofomes roseus TaxID=34475 RepID=A0ABQ8K4K9_9APHY|nr:uncharacterized protein C8Q71DRAFT_285904 [Rhodofomes roseus]KAH9831805.1 hypothetical protein C8Q71DRAFT_285904 [Rhodofomes roseus]
MRVRSLCVVRTRQSPPGAGSPCVRAFRLVSIPEGTPPRSSATLRLHPSPACSSIGIAYMARRFIVIAFPGLQLLCFYTITSQSAQRDLDDVQRSSRDPEPEAINIIWLSGPAYHDYHSSARLPEHLRRGLLNVLVAYTRLSMLVLGAVQLPSFAPLQSFLCAFPNLRRVNDLDWAVHLLEPRLVAWEMP